MDSNESKQNRKWMSIEWMRSDEDKQQQQKSVEHVVSMYNGDGLPTNPSYKDNLQRYSWCW